MRKLIPDLQTLYDAGLIRPPEDCPHFEDLTPATLLRSLVLMGVVAWIVLLIAVSSLAHMVGDTTLYWQGVSVVLFMMVLFGWVDISITHAEVLQYAQDVEGVEENSE